MPSNSTPMTLLSTAGAPNMNLLTNMSSLHRVLVHLLKYFLCHMKSRVRRRYAAIARGLHQHFLDFVARHAIVGGSAQMQLQFFFAVERHHHGDGKQAARVARQSGAG